MYNVVFWKDLFERLISTLAQVALGLLATVQVTDANVDWRVWATTLVVSGVAVVLKAFAADKLVDSSVSPASLVSTDARDLV